MSLVFMFPGQSSRYPGMLHKLAELHSGNRILLQQASELLNRDLARHYSADNPDAYACNTDVQIGVFLANHMFLQILDDAGIQADGSLGLSLGEWNHLVHIGALPFEQALLAVEQRGAAYDAGPRGAMASVFPISAEELREVAQRVDGLLEVVNLNSPRQQVLSGESAALDQALKILDDELFVDAVIIERQVPMHSSLFAPVGERFAEVLQQLSFTQPALPYLPNRLGRFIEQAQTEQFVELLSTHVYRPVLWRTSIEQVLGRWPEATLVEVGPKAVLYNLLDRKWVRGVKKFHTDTADNTAEHLERVIAELGAAVDIPADGQVSCAG